MTLVKTDRPLQAMTTTLEELQAEQDRLEKELGVSTSQVRTTALKAAVSETLSKMTKLSGCSPKDYRAIASLFHWANAQLFLRLWKSSLRGGR